MCKQGQGSWDWPLSVLRGSIFPKLLSTRLFISHRRGVVPVLYIPTAEHFLQPFRDDVCTSGLGLIWFSCSLRFGTRGILTCTTNQVPVLQHDECSPWEEFGKEYCIPCRALWEGRWYSLMLQAVPVFCLLPGNQEVMGLAVPVSVSSLLSSPFPFSSWHECDTPVKFSGS